MTTYIYDLVDPITLNIRYVGKSIRPKERLLNQCNEKSNTYRCHWIQSLIKQGLRPLQYILEELPDDYHWQEREQYWIRRFRDLGFNLVNGTDGGDGVVNLNDESKQRIISAWLGRKHKPESIIKISLASKGRKHDDKWRQYMHDKLKSRQFSHEDRMKLSCGVSKLNLSQINEVKTLLSNGIPQRKIAKIYGVHQGTISNIKLGKYCKWLNEENY